MSTVSPTQPRIETNLPDDELLRLYRLMVLIRRFEERAEEQYTRARIGGYLHLNIGEEATVVGTATAVQGDDYIFASYRDHGVALAIGAAAKDVMAELFGKESGMAHGRGGSMHLLDVERRFLGGWGIVGGQIPIAVGAALALDYHERPGAVMCLFGDGAVATGAFHEALNLAGLWHLPCLFVITNNQYGMGTSVERSSAEPELYKRAAAYKMPGERVDGQDVLAVREATARLLRLARDERQPSVLECMTYRYRGHSPIDPGKGYRSQEEMEYWRARDPLTQFEARLRKRGLLSKTDAERVAEEVDREVQEAIDFSLQDPEPDPSALYHHVYGEAGAEQFARMAPGAPFGERSIEAAPLTPEPAAGPPRETLTN
ncbi:MAG TPA: pyruvate dehydrogenase (acetyl-transferring) E1 component subunit alpha [Chloroflexota bacterium]|jgi:pyruvate dehydrogenase E1 component alpha subunit|nr:pyruvate dehydrogenase (acetyl-transferring) E1 component subunit alpha [Chloroflexota bacterium]